ncbi:hypothetical protein TNCV_1842121 [Trichonephila clavipes]|nr:hypothetical protein TNCV_1842121 [Trichonephila clavipes]
MKDLRIIRVGEVKTTLITAMQSYTSYPSTATEIKRQAVGTFVKMKASHRVQWMNECKPSTMKTQMSSLEACEKLQEINESKPMNCRERSCLIPLRYPTTFRTVIL